MATRSCAPVLLFAAIMATLALSGCVDSNGGDEADAQPDEPGERGGIVEGIGPEFVVLMNPIDATGCRNVQILLEVPESHAVSLLPDGFRPAPGPVTGQDAGMSIEAHHCASSVSEEIDAAYSRVWVSVQVLPPTLPDPAAGFQKENRTDPGQADQATDQYVVAAYMDGVGFQRFLNQAGIVFEQAWIDIELAVFVDTMVAQLEVEEKGGGSVVLQSVTLAHKEAEWTEHRTSWAVSRHGVQAFEEHQAKGLGEPVARYTGSGVCLAGFEGLFESVLPSTGCMANLVRVSDGFDVTGHSLWFHDTRVLG